MSVLYTPQNVINWSRCPSLILYKRPSSTLIRGAETVRGEEGDRLGKCLVGANSKCNPVRPSQTQQVYANTQGQHADIISAIRYMHLGKRVHTRPTSEYVQYLTSAQVANKQDLAKQISNVPEQDCSSNL